MKTPNDYIRRMAEEGKYGQYFLTLIVSVIIVSAIMSAATIYFVPNEVLCDIVRWITSL